MLESRKVVLYPDLNGFEKWSEKARKLRSIDPLGINSVLEEVATDEERKQGLDIADFFVQYSLNEFTDLDKGVKTKEKGQETEVVDDFDDTIWPEIAWEEENPTPIRLIKQEDWSEEIAEVETFFAGISSIEEPIRLNSYSNILNAQRFVEGNLATVKANNGKPWFKVYLDHLKELRGYLGKVELVSK
jgi:hypothetical protein